MKKKYFYFILFFILISSNFAQSNTINLPDVNKNYKCKVFAGGVEGSQEIVELQFSNVKKKPFKVEDLSKLNTLYVVSHKTEAIGIDLSTLQYAYYKNGQAYIFVVNYEDLKELNIMLFTNDNGWKFFDLWLTLDNETFDKIRKYSGRFGYNLDKYNDIINLSEEDYKKEISTLLDLYVFTVELHQSGKISNFLTSQMAYNCE